MLRTFHYQGSGRPVVVNMGEPTLIRPWLTAYPVMSGAGGFFVICEMCQTEDCMGARVLRSVRQRTRFVQQHRRCGFLTDG